MTNSDLNRPHRVTLTEGQISTILYVLEGYIQGSDDYHFDDNFKNDVDKIFEELEGAIDKQYPDDFTANDVQQCIIDGNDYKECVDKLVESMNQS
tara:strand:+ start:657 stop:941 length:285 start_codon:yes stop_codon:yes gene_type:complete